MTKKEIAKMIGLHNDLRSKTIAVQSELEDGIYLHEYSDQDAARHAINHRETLLQVMAVIRDVLGKRVESRKEDQHD